MRLPGSFNLIQGAEPTVTVLPTEIIIRRLAAAPDW
jgi:hypothetical protein